MDVTPSKQSQIVALGQHGGLSIRQIADQWGVAKSTVGRIVKSEDKDGDISIHHRGKCGKKRKTTSHDDKTIIRNSIKVVGKQVKSCKVI